MESVLVDISLGKHGSLLVFSDLFVNVLFSVLILELNPNSTDTYGLFYCCSAVPLPQIREGLSAYNLHL